MYEEELNAYFNRKKEEIIASLSRLVAVRSVRGEATNTSPFGEGPALALAEAEIIARELGFSVKNYDNYVIAVDFNKEETQLSIFAHLDVVAEGEGWNTPPYRLTEKDGLLFGRGTSDDKGPALAALYAMAAVKEAGVPLARNVRLVLGSDEECGSHDLARYFTCEPFPPMSFTPDTSFPVINTEKGRFAGSFFAEYDEGEKTPRVLSIQGGETVNAVPAAARAVVAGLSQEELKQICRAFEEKTGVSFALTEGEEGQIVAARGKAAHASLPHLGNNPVTALLSLLAALPLASGGGADKIRALASLFPHGDWAGKAAGVAMEDEFSGALTLSLDLFSFGGGKLTGTVDCRVPLAATEENMSLVLRRRLAEAGISLPSTAMSPAHHVAADSPLVRTLLSCYEAHTGNKGYCEAIGGGTYVHRIEGGVAFGALMPGADTNMHGANEFIPLADLLTAGKIFAEAIVRLCGA